MTVVVRYGRTSATLCPRNTIRQRVWPRDAVFCRGATDRTEVVPRSSLTRARGRHCYVVVTRRPELENERDVTNVAALGKFYFENEYRPGSVRSNDGREKGRQKNTIVTSFSFRTGKKDRFEDLRGDSVDGSYWCVSKIAIDVSEVSVKRY